LENIVVQDSVKINFGFVQKYWVSRNKKM